MSLSGQYLEELSRRYKKQVEEMQRSFERTVSAMNEETRKRDERETKRIEEIAILKEKVVNLSNSIKDLLYDRESWRGKISMIGQHMLLICSEVLVIYLILIYCWGSNHKKAEVKVKRQSEKDSMRRKSAENFNSHMKKTKKRRPSEIASNITGTYRELMIIDKSHEIKKEKKKKRKKTTTSISNQTNINNDINMYPITQYRNQIDVTHEMNITPEIVSSIEVLHSNESQKQICEKFNWIPENTIEWFNDVHKTGCNMMLCTNNSKIDSIQNSELSSSYVKNSNESNLLSSNVFPEKVHYTEQTAIEKSEDPLNISGILKDTSLSVTSSFMKTALSTRKKRKSYSNDMNEEWNKNSGDSNDNTVQVSIISSKPSSENIDPDIETSSNGLLMNQSDESRSSSITSISKKKEKKNTSFRKMVRKFF